jgi:hypothetical protein
MKTRRLAVMTLSLALAAAVLLAPGAGAAAKATPGGDLYLLQAKGGVIGGSKLVLHGVQPSVASFSDRPRRSAGSIEAPRLAARWGKIFGGVAPNAALEVQGAPKDADVALIELRSPRYDRADHTLTFSVHRLKHVGDPALKELDRRADGDAVKKFGAASLFIDNGGEPEVGVTVRAYTVGNGPVSVLFSGGIQYLGGVTGINTPVLQGKAATGEVDFTSKSLIFDATDEGNGMSADVYVEVASTGGHLTGEASLVNGGSIELVIGEGAPIKLSNGPFDIPVS